MSAPIVPIAVTALRASEALPATGVAIGLYMLIAVTCLLAGWGARWKSARMLRRR